MCRGEWREAHLKVCTHTRVTRMLGLHPSHESKLFETEKEIRGGGRVNERETLNGGISRKMEGRAERGRE